MSNLLKSAYVKENDSENRIIDSNEIVAERLRVLAEKMEQQFETDEEAFEEGFVEGLDADQVEELMADRENSAEQPGMQAKIDEAKAELLRLQEQADQVVESAKAQADALIADAKEQARQIEADARNSGHEEGYQTGYQEGMEKAAEAERALAEEKEQLEQSYEEKINEMEPQLMSVLCDIYQHVFGVDMEGRSDVVVYLLQHAMQNIEGGTNYLVHVSPDDHAYATEHKDELLSYTGPAGTLEIVEDHTLKQGQSYIETESGIFDCSFGVEMELLCKELKLLSRSEV
ncbi:MAG: hypothetical protein K6E16_02635 [Lachnospiraceae bacterium]|nr:hypothetical protein [Lachnospiraceae bacterium]